MEQQHNKRLVDLTDQQRLQHDVDALGLTEQMLNLHAILPKHATPNEVIDAVQKSTSRCGQRQRCLLCRSRAAECMLDVQSCACSVQHGAFEFAEGGAVCQLALAADAHLELASAALAAMSLLLQILMEVCGFGQYTAKGTCVVAAGNHCWIVAQIRGDLPLCNCAQATGGCAGQLLPVAVDALLDHVMRLGDALRAPGIIERAEAFSGDCTAALCTHLVQESESGNPLQLVLTDLQPAAASCVRCALHNCVHTAACLARAAHPRVCWRSEMDVGCCSGRHGSI